MTLATERSSDELLAELAERFEVSEDEFLAALRGVGLLLPRLREPFVLGEPSGSELFRRRLERS